MSKHTPGPWVWKKLGAGKNADLVLWGDHGDRPIVLDFVRYGMQGAWPRVRGKNGIMAPFDSDHPDARLIAAAPDMAEACAEYHNNGDTERARMLVDRALRKVDGGNDGV